MFAEERESDSPEEETPENGAPEGVPGEPGESAPESGEAAESAAPGPEIEGAEALSAASDEEPAAEPAAEAEEPAAEGEQPAADRPPRRERGEEKSEEEVIRLAVKGMLPRNRLARAQLRKLKVYAGPDHPHAAQKPEPLEVEA